MPMEKKKGGNFVGLSRDLNNFFLVEMVYNSTANYAKLISLRLEKFTLAY